MRRLIVGMLVFFILFANLAWAADMDGIGIAHNSTKVIASFDGASGSSDDSDTGHDGIKSSFCDHCCHGSAHYVGFIPRIVTPSIDCGSVTQAAPQTAYYSRDLEPPLPPPNI